MTTCTMTTEKALRELGLRDGVEYHLDNQHVNGQRLWWLNPQGLTVEMAVSDLPLYLYERLGVEIED